MPEDTPTRRDLNREELNLEEPTRAEPNRSTRPNPPEPTTEATTEPPPISRQDLFETILTPVANPADGRETARAVRAYLDAETTVYVAHVVQKGEGVPDKAGVAQRLEFAERVYAAFAEEFDRPTASIEPTEPDAPHAPPTPTSSVRSGSSVSSSSSGPSPTPVTLYGRNVSRTILAGAHDVGATAVVFTPRGAGRWTKLLTGNVAEGLLREAEIPIVALPRLNGRLVLD